MKAILEEIMQSNTAFLKETSLLYLKTYKIFQEHKKKYASDTIEEIELLKLTEALEAFDGFIANDPTYKNLSTNKRYFKNKRENFAFEYIIELFRTSSEEMQGSSLLKFDYENFIELVVLSIIYENLIEFVELISREVHKNESDVIFILERYKNLKIFHTGTASNSFTNAIGKDLEKNIYTFKRTSKARKSKQPKIDRRKEIARKLALEIDPRSINKKYRIAEEIAKELHKHLPTDECVGKDTIAKDLVELGLYQ